MIKQDPVIYKSKIVKALQVDDKPVKKQLPLLKPSEASFVTPPPILTDEKSFEPIYVNNEPKLLKSNENIGRILSVNNCLKIGDITSAERILKRPLTPEEIANASISGVDRMSALSAQANTEVDLKLLKDYIKNAKLKLLADREKIKETDSPAKQKRLTDIDKTIKYLKILKNGIKDDIKEGKEIDTKSVKQQVDTTLRLGSVIKSEEIDITSPKELGLRSYPVSFSPTKSETSSDSEESTIHIRSESSPTIEIAPTEPGIPSGVPSPSSSEPGIHVNEDEFKGLSIAQSVMLKYGDKGEHWETKRPAEYSKEENEEISQMRAAAVDLQPRWISIHKDITNAHPKQLIKWLAQAINVYEIVRDTGALEEETTGTGRAKFKNIDHKDVIIHKDSDSKAITAARQALIEHGIVGEKLIKGLKNKSLNLHLRNVAKALQKNNIIDSNKQYPTNKASRSVLKDISEALTKHDRNKAIEEPQSGPIVHTHVGDRIKILVSEIDNGNTSMLLREELKDTAKYAVKRKIIPKELYKEILDNYVYDI
jgi:hypothetical protein